MNKWIVLALLSTLASCGDYKLDKAGRGEDSTLSGLFSQIWGQLGISVVHAQTPLESASDQLLRSDFISSSTGLDYSSVVSDAISAAATQAQDLGGYKLSFVFVREGDLQYRQSYVFVDGTPKILNVDFVASATNIKLTEDLANDSTLDLTIMESNLNSYKAEARCSHPWYLLTFRARRLYSFNPYSTDASQVGIGA